MITVYDQRETDFSHNGYGQVIAASAVVTEELNGRFELVLTCHALENNRAWRHLAEFAVIKAATPRGMQLFRVYQVKKEMLERKVTAYARHIFYDGLFNLTNCSPDIIKGTARGMVIRYGKNLTGLDMELNCDNMATRIVPVGYDWRGNPMLMNGIFTSVCYIDSANAGLYFMPFYMVVKHPDLKEEKGKDAYWTAEKVKEALWRRTAEMLKDWDQDMPEVNAKVDFVLLRETEEYQDYAALEEVQLGDTVRVWHEGLGIDVRARCIQYQYDSILERYVKMEIGQFREDLYSSINQNVTTAVAKGMQSVLEELNKSDEEEV